MALTFRHECQGCGAELKHDSEAFICAYECTFCAECAGRVGEVCPNCGGELVRRPKWRAGVGAGAAQGSCTLAG